MSLIPRACPWYCRPSPSYDYFGHGIPQETHPMFNNFLNLNLDPEKTSKHQIAAFGKDGFQACVDVKHFKPNEITVKTIDNTVIVEGKHEALEDEHGYISRQFVRKYILPEGYDHKEVVSTLSSDGILTIKAPILKSSTENVTERTVQIQQTGPAHLNVKEKSKEESVEEKK